MLWVLLCKFLVFNNTRKMSILKTKILLLSLITFFFMVAIPIYMMWLPLIPFILYTRRKSFLFINHFFCLLKETRTSFVIQMRIKSINIKQNDKIRDIDLYTVWAILSDDMQLRLFEWEWKTLSFFFNIFRRVTISESFTSLKIL